MGRPTGTAMLPLHGGRVPAWLATRMARLGRVITEAIVLEYGRDEFLRRIAHPFWFQSFGAVMGMDWHSSGITTSVLGALKKGLDPVRGELGLHVCGGRGRHSRRTPDELRAVGHRTGLDGEALADTSKLVAKVDSAAVQDGYELYLHGFLVADDGAWAVIQQGMNGGTKQARRYHWLSEGLESFVEAPHRAIEDASGPGAAIVNLTDRRASATRERTTELVGDPDRVVAVARKLREREAPAPREAQAPLPHLQLPAHHDLKPSDVVLRRLHGTLAAAAERGPTDFADLLETSGVGARTVFTLASVAEVIYGTPSRFSDPGRFSTALGGKDGHPFPVPLRVYDHTIHVLRHAVRRAKLGEKDRLSAIEKLDRQARLLESVAEGPTLPEFIRDERRRSHEYGGMTVMGPAKAPRGARRKRAKVGDRSPQLGLPGLDEE